MTIEIRELVIQATIVTPGEVKSTIPARSLAQEKVDEIRWVEMITQRVVEKLREDGRWMR